MKSGHGVPALAWLLGAAVTVQAQMGFHTLQVSNPGEGYYDVEVAAALDPNNALRQMVAWIDRDIGGTYTNIWYASTNNGWATSGAPALLPLSLPVGYTANGTDPVVVALADGSFILGALVQDALRGNYFATVTFDPSGHTSADEGPFFPPAPYTDNFDKPALAVGPSVSGSQERVYLLHSLFNTCTAFASPRVFGLERAGWASSATEFEAIPPAFTACGHSEWLGHGVASAVMRYQPRIGYILGAATYGARDENNTADGPVRVLYSDNEGQAGHWFQSTSGNGGINQTAGNPAQPIGRILYFPDIAVDPNHPEIVYVAFTARVGTSTDYDVVIARSVDGGVTFPSTDVLHLPLTSLGPTKVFVAIAVDGAPATAGGPGGLNIFVYGLVGFHCTPYYMRIPVWSPQPSLLMAPAALPDPGHPQYFSAGPDQLRDYYDILASGCAAWCFYVRPDPVTGRRAVFVTRVDGLCPGDSDTDSAFTAGDAGTFLQRFAVGDPLADRNHDGVVSLPDFTQWIQEFLCQCGVP